MASVTVEKVVRRDWIMANPWLWSFLGLGLCLAAWGMVLALGDELAGLRVAAIFLGVLSAGAAVALRLNSSRSAYLDQLAPGLRKKIALALTLLFILVVLALTVLLVLRFFEINPAGLRLNGLIILWLFLCPLCVGAALSCLRRAGPDRAVTPAEEGAALLTMAALTAFCASWALFNRDNPLAWDSFRLFLGVVFLVALVAAPLVVVSQAARRLAVSALILLHFGGIMMASLSAPPSPWIVQQIWGRIYQPYLEFMYLNNAYHFYAPEPGPASYLWFRMFYEDPEGNLWAHWLKVPDVDEEGWHNYALGLVYQRMLAVTENVTYCEPAPNMYATQADGTFGYAPWYADRLAHSPNQLLGNVGDPELKSRGLIVPFHPSVPFAQQYLKPNESCRALLSSYARHICLEPHPVHRNWKINKVKIYRVVHRIPDVNAFINEDMDPRDPMNYWPYYVGEYDPQGNLLDGGHIDTNGKRIPADPFLYWMLPILRDSYELKSDIRSWAAKHAGDPDWTYRYDEKKQRHVILQEAR